jgi:hypothetical protein
VPDLGASYIKNSTALQALSNFNISGNGTIGGSLVAATLSGSGAGLTSLNATNISTGTLSNARLGTIPISNGGTGITSGPTAAGQFLRSAGAGAWAVGGIAASDLPTLPYVAKAGDTMTGALNLPANGLVAGVNQLVLSAGNVGIGTTTPAAKLDVTGNIALNSNMLRLLSGGDNTNGILYNGTVSGPEFRGFAGFMWTGGLGELMRLNLSGLGIGTTAPAARLHIGNANSPSSGIFVEATEGDRAALYYNANAGVVFDSFRPSDLRRLPVLLQPSGGNVGIGTTTPAFPLTVAGTIHSTNGGFRFPDGTTQTTAATGGGVTSVGATPPLFSSGGATPNLSLTGTVPVANGGTGLSTSGVVGNYLRSNGTAWASAALQAADVPDLGASYIKNSSTVQASSNFNISGNGTIGGNLIANGNVGIGTTTPAAKLDVAGNIALNSNMLRLQNGGSSTNGMLYNATVSGPEFRGSVGFMWTSGIGELMRLTPSGLGIGTTSPTQLLTLNSAGTPRLAIRSGSFFTSQGTSPDDGPFYLWQNTSALRFATATDDSGQNFSEKMRITSTGNVGIGTTDPKERQQIGTSMAFHDGGHKIMAFGWSPTLSQALQNGVPAEIRWDPTNGSLSLGIDSTSRLAGETIGDPPQLMTLKQGNVGIGTPPSATSKLTVAGVIESTSGGFRFPDGSVQFVAATGGGGGVSNVTASVPLASSGGTTPNISLTGVVPIANGGTGSATKNFVDLTTAQTIGGAKNFSGNLGIGTVSPTQLLTLNSAGDARLAIHSGLMFTSQGTSSADGPFYLWKDTTALRFATATNDSGSGWSEKMRITSAGNVGIGTTNPTEKLEVVGTTKTQVLQITGGSDLSEKFEVKAALDANSDTSWQQIRPGMVVSIDPNHPGKLVVSSQAYDRRVAGIISGAGGVKPGLLMGQAGSVADGDYPIALTGRVYCWVDASNGPIEPGDLLTTSNTPGYAMKVTNYPKAQGAIIGKAMTGLNEGKGLVLVLVTLQ